MRLQALISGQTFEEVSFKKNKKRNQSKDN